MSQDIIKKHRDFLIRLFNERAPIARSMGMTLSYDDRDRALFHMPYQSSFDHALNGIHGGVFATLLDNAGWFTVAPHFETWIVTIEFHVRLLEAVAGQGLWSRGEIVRLGKRISVARMEVRSDSNQLIATGSGTFAPTKRRYEEAL